MVPAFKKHLVLLTVPCQSCSSLSTVPADALTTEHPGESTEMPLMCNFLFLCVLFCVHAFLIYINGIVIYLNFLYFSTQHCIFKINPYDYMYTEVSISNCYPVLPGAPASSTYCLPTTDIDCLQPPASTNRVPHTPSSRLQI